MTPKMNYTPKSRVQKECHFLYMTSYSCFFDIGVENYKDIV